MAAISHSMTQALITARSGKLRARGGRIAATSERGYPVRVIWPTVESLERRKLLVRETSPDADWSWEWKLTDLGREVLAGLVAGMR